MENHKCYNIVYSSSATVYGEPEKMPITEDMPLIPQSVYGRTKMMGEMMIKDVCDCHPTLWKGISLRYFNPAGEFLRTFLFWI
jgi:UDP-glucose 4-epimerase